MRIEVAHIVPAAYLRDLPAQLMHLVLPQELMHNVSYRDFYVDAYEGATAEGAYIILDNGAAEKQQVSLDSLLTCAMFIGADEVALPDVMGNALATVASTKAGLKHALGYFTNLNIPFKFGAVAQGQNAYEAYNCARVLLEGFGGLIEVIYLPRLLVKQDQRDIRVKLAKMIKEEYPDVQIHMFGLSQNFPGELALMNEYRHYIRSVDTSAAACHAAIGLRPTQDWYSTPVVRPKAFFSGAHVSSYRRHLHNYTSLLNKWVNPHEKASSR